MSDKITLKRIELIHPSIKEELKQIYAEICEALTGRAICRFTHTYRTFAEQDALYAIGRTKKGKRVTNAKGGQSYHNFRLAIDFCLVIDGKVASWDRKYDFDGDNVNDWEEVVKIFKMYGWEYGGDWATFPDYPHFQKTLGKSIKDLQRMYEAQGKPEYLQFSHI